MSLKAQIPLSKSVASQACTFSTSLTPFLYQTKTLEGHSWDAKCKNPLRRPHKGHRSFCSTSRNSAQANETPLHDPISSENTSNLLLSVPAKYRIRVPGTKTNTPIPRDDVKLSWQSSLIDRICSQLSPLPGNGDIEKDDETYGINSKVFEQIDEILELAIRELAFQENRMSEHILKHRRLYFYNPPPRALDVSYELGKIPRHALPAKEPLRGLIDASRDLAEIPHRALPAKEPLRGIIDASRDLAEIPHRALAAEEPLRGTTDGSHNLDTSVPSGETPGKAVDEFQLERRIHESDFMRELACAHTDDAVWSALEKKVFRLIGRIEKRNEDDASKRDDKTSFELATPKKPTRRKGQPEENETDAVLIEADAKAEAKPTKPRRRKEQPEPKETSPVPLKVEAEATFQSPSPASSLALVTRPSPKMIKLERTSSIIHHNYGRYCLKALQLLRQEFPTSPYALMILPTIKKLGSISYVLGATSGLYNELLHLKWTEYADLHGMADILEEMRNQGVQQDRGTAAVVRLVERERDAQLNNNEDDENAEEGGIIDEEEDEQRDQRHPIEARSENSHKTATAAWWKLRQVQEVWIRLLDNFHPAKRLTEEQQQREVQDEQHMREVEEAEARLDDANVSRPEEVGGGAPSIVRKVSGREIKVGGEAPSIVRRVSRGREKKVGEEAPSIVRRVSRRREKKLVGEAPSIVKRVSRSREKKVDGGAPSIVRRVSRRREKNVGGGAPSIVRRVSRRLEKKVGGGAPSIVRRVSKRRDKKVVGGTPSIVTRQSRRRTKKMSEGASSIVKRVSRRRERKMGGGAPSIVRRVSKR